MDEKITHAPPVPTKDIQPPAAYFQSLTIENLRCFGPAQTLHLADEVGKPYQWTIILGDNGVGKTTLLQFLALQQFHLAVNGGVFKQHYHAHPSMLYELNGPFRPRNLRIKAHVRCRIQAINGGLHSDTVQSESLITIEAGANGAAVYHDALSPDTLICYGYGASRRMGSVSLYDDDNPNTYEGLFSDGVEMLSPIEWLLTNDYAATLDLEQKTGAKQKLEKVKSILLRLLPGIESFRFVPSPGTGKIQVEASVPYGWVPVSQLSLGYQTSMTWIVDLASRLIDRYPDSPDPLAEPAIVLIDEIDLHLHPQWQRQIIQQLTDIFKNTQFIVTAHSPLVVQAAQDANIVLLKREEDYVVIENEMEAVRNWRVDQILTSDLFGLPSARPPQQDAALDERATILSKPRLTARDRKRLDELNSEIGHLPAGDTLEDDEAMQLIREIAEAAKSNKAAA